jgi:hypothetical protein
MIQIRKLWIEMKDMSTENSLVLLFTGLFFAACLCWVYFSAHQVFQLWGVSLLPEIRSLGVLAISSCIAAFVARIFWLFWWQYIVRDIVTNLRGKYNKNGYKIRL